MCNFDTNTETETNKSHDIDTISIVSSISDEWVPDPYHMQSFHEKEEVFTIVGGRELHRKKISLFLYGKNEKYMSAFSPGKKDFV